MRVGVRVYLQYLCFLASPIILPGKMAEIRCLRAFSTTIHNMILPARRTVSPSIHSLARYTSIGGGTVWPAVEGSAHASIWPRSKCSQCVPCILMYVLAELWWCSSSLQKATAQKQPPVQRASASSLPDSGCAVCVCVHVSECVCVCPCE